MAHPVVTPLVILPSASRGDTTTTDFTNNRYVGGEFIVNQTVQGTTDAFVSVKIQGKIPGTTSYYTIGTITPATSATFVKRMRIYPGASTALDSTGLQPSPAPYVVNDCLPAIWRVASTNVSASNVTFSVSANLFGAAQGLTVPYAGDPIGIPRDAVRALVGDLSTSSTGEFLGDAEYDFFISATPNTYLAAQLAANSLAALFTGSAASVNGSGYVEKSVGDLTIKKSDAVQAAAGYKQLAALFGRRAAAGISPYAGGISVSDKAAVEADADRVAPAFVLKMFDNSRAHDFGTGVSST